MQINDPESIPGIKRSSIFYYEREGLLEPTREDNNYREYSEGDLRRLKLVVVLREPGFTGAEIRALLDDASVFHQAPPYQYATPQMTMFFAGLPQIAQVSPRCS